MRSQRELVLLLAGISLIFAIFSADSPIVSPVDGSAMAGVIGHEVPRTDAGEGAHAAAELFALRRRDEARLKPREWRIGTLESDSAPPAMTMSAWPRAIWSAASVIAWLADAQARLSE